MGGKGERQRMRLWVVTCALFTASACLALVTTLALLWPA